MTNLVRSQLRPSVLFLAVGFVAGTLAGPHLGVVSAQSSPKVFELRTYTAPEGKLSDLHKASATTRCASSRSTA